MAILALLSFLNILALPIVTIMAFSRKNDLWLPLPFMLLQFMWMFLDGPERIVYLMSGKAGVGMLLLLAPAFLLLLALIIFLVGCGVLISRVRKGNQRASWLMGYLISGIFSLFLLAYPFNLTLQFIEQCDERTDQAASTIIDALNTYKMTEGQYPETLEILVPDYLSAIPKAHCLEGLAQQRDTDESGESASKDVDTPKFEICRDSVVIPNFIDAFVVGYDLETKKSASISFLDDPECYFKGFKK